MKMKKLSGRSLKGSKKGQMPFALIAVTLLLLGSAYGAVCANLENTEENTEEIINELKSMDDAIDDAKKAIRIGLGDILNTLSTDEDGGNLLDRINMFDELTERWMSNNFPMRDRGITTTLIDYELGVTVESMRLSSGDELTDASKASYLKASGTVSLKFVSSTGSSERTLDISADGTTGLPFIVNNATEFELSSEGDTSILTQLMSYQLSSLAQYRIMNGYGALSESGNKGTRSIITESDVNKAFENAVEAIEQICFRTGNYDGTQVDLGEAIVLADGYYEIDTSAIVAQTLLSIADVLILRWCDLFFADAVIDAADTLSDFEYECEKTLINFIKGVFGKSQDYDSAVKYLKNAMNRYNLDENEYRYSRIGSSSITIPAGTYGASSTYVDEMSVDIGDFSADIFGWDGWNDYVSKYNGSTNAFEEKIKSTFNSICMDTAAYYGKYYISADENDDVPLTESLSKAVGTAIEKCNMSFGDVISNKIKHTSVSDPLYSAIYDTMTEQRSAIFKEDEFRNMVYGQIRDRICSTVDSEGTLLDQSVVDEIMSQDCVKEQIDSIVGAYTEDVDSVISAFETVLNSIPTNDSSIVKDALIKAGQLALSSDFVSEMIKTTANSMIDDTIDYLTLNAKCGITDLGDEDSFILYDGSGNRCEEFTAVEESYMTEVKITPPSKNPSKCYHNVGIDEISLSAYTSVFTVEFDADVTYTVHTMSSIDKSLGIYDSSFRNSFKISTTLEISCASGWGLAGVDYQSSTNILETIWEQILSAVSSLVEPVRDLYNVIQDIFEMCSTAIVKLSAYSTELLSQFYSVMESFIEQAILLVENGLIMTIVNNIESFDIGSAKQELTFSYFGLMFTITLKGASVLKTVKNIVKITIEGSIGDSKISAYIDVKYSKKNGIMAKFGGGIDNKDWGIDVDIDPKLKFGSKIFSVDGNIGDVDFSIAMPQRVLYEEAELRLSDISGVSKILSNIPLPIAGYKGSLDLGFDLKYNLPIGTGLVINEFESNPAGTDSGNEWVELYNATAKSIDLTGYTIVPESNPSKAYELSGITIAAMGKAVIELPSQMLNNSKSGTHNGESVSLYDPDGNKVDSTPWKKDTANNDKTWQRTVDGGSVWEFLDSTQGECNGKYIKADAVMKEFILDNLLKAAEDAFEELNSHLTSMDDIEKFLRLTVEKFINRVIKTIADCIVGASIFIELELTDYSGSSHTGLRISLDMDSDLVEEGLRWLLNQIDLLDDFVKDPKCDDPLNIVCENTYFNTTVYKGISAPKILPNMNGMEIRAGFSVALNISTVCNLIGDDHGKWKVKAGIILEGLDPSLLPTGLKSNTGKTCDLWAISMEFSAH